MIPLTLRKEVGIHPEAFRRLISDLDEFALISIRALPRQRSSGRRTPGILRVPVRIEMTATGRNVLEVTGQVRDAVKRHARLLPASCARHWLTA
jgi:hypothetical protein